jgi:hypothetical protein
LLPEAKNQMFEELYHIQNCELALGMLYQEMVSRFGDEKWFWEKAIADEINHARNIGKLIALVSDNIDKYLPGKYRTEVLKTFLDGIYHHIDMIKNNKLKHDEIFQLILDYEKSPVESRPYEVVKSFEPEFTNFCAEFEDDIRAHSLRIIAYMKEKMHRADRTAKLFLKNITQPEE